MLPALPLRELKFTYRRNQNTAPAGEVQVYSYYAGYVKVYLNNEPVIAGTLADCMES